MCSNSPTANLNPDDIIFNFSDRVLTQNEKNILSRGLNFATPRSKLDYCDFLVPFELLRRQLRCETFSNSTTEEFFKTKLKDIALSGYRNFSPPNFLLTSDDYKTLKGLKDDKNIIIIKPDKGNGVVILNRCDYNQKMNAILSDTTKFKTLTSDPLKATLSRETKLRNFLRGLKKENVISDELYKKLCPTGAKPGILYGLPKVHKADVPLRPILSAIGTHSYNLSKYLVSLLRPISSNDFTITDTFSFLNDLRTLNLNCEDFVS